MDLTIKYKNRIQELAGIRLIKEGIEKNNLNIELNKKQNIETNKIQDQFQSTLSRESEERIKNISNISELKDIIIEYMGGTKKKNIGNILEEVKERYSGYLD